MEMFLNLTQGGMCKEHKFAWGGFLKKYQNTTLIQTILNDFAIFNEKIISFTTPIKAF